MLSSLKNFEGYRIYSAGGEYIGKTDDFLFDQDTGVIMFLVIDVGKWFTGLKLLVPPNAFEESDWLNRIVKLNMTKDEVEKSPNIGDIMPEFRREKLRNLDRKSGLVNCYWMPDRYVCNYHSMGGMKDGETSQLEEKLESLSPRLGSFKDIIGHHIRASDGDIGHVEDIIVERGTWQIRYLVVNTGKWLPGRKVIVSFVWLTSIDWKNRAVNIDLTIDRIRQSPGYDPEEPVNREYEIVLHDYYGRPVYWKAGGEEEC